MKESTNGWKTIESAPKDKVIIVNDTTGQSQWVSARWVESPYWSGWTYDDNELADYNPKGPEPTHWFDIPPVPNNK